MLTHDDLAHLGADVLAAVLRHRGPKASPAMIAAWIDERIEYPSRVDRSSLRAAVYDGPNPRIDGRLPAMPGRLA